MSRHEMDKLQDIYESMYIENMMAADVLGDSPGLEGGSIENTDSYATGSTVIPKVLGISRRNKINNIFDPLKHQKGAKSKKNGKKNKKM
jgi:hypothetical protein